MIARSIHAVTWVAGSLLLGAILVAYANPEPPAKPHECSLSVPAEHKIRAQEDQIRELFSRVESLEAK